MTTLMLTAAPTPPDVVLEPKVWVAGICQRPICTRPFVIPVPVALAPQTGPAYCSSKCAKRGMPIWWRHREQRAAAGLCLACGTGTREYCDELLCEDCLRLLMSSCGRKWAHRRSRTAAVVAERSTADAKREQAVYECLLHPPRRAWHVGGVVPPEVDLRRKVAAQVVVWAFTPGQIADIVQQWRAVTERPRRRGVVV